MNRRQPQQEGRKVTQSFEEDCADLIGTEEKKGMSLRDLLKFAASIGIPMALVPGMTRKALAAELGVVVIDPTQAAVAMALGAVASDGS